MRQSRLSGSVEGVMGNHDSYSDLMVYDLQTSGDAPLHASGMESALTRRDLCRGRTIFNSLGFNLPL